MDQAKEQTPDDLFALASQLHAQGRLEETKTVLQRLLAAAPDHATALNLMGIACGQQGDLPTGCGYVERAIAIAGDQPIFLRNLCELRRQNDDAFNAVTAGRRAVAVAPDDLIARLNLAMAEQDALDLDAALDNALSVAAIEPENGSAHFLIAQVALMRGDLPLGWKEYAWRWKIPGADRPRPAAEVPDWSGAPIEGTLLLIADQGFGDILQFARYLPWARSRCGTLIIGCPRDVRGLIQRLMPDTKVVSDVSGLETADAFEVFSSLPGLAGATLETILPGGYLATDPARVARWRHRLDQVAPPPNRRIAIAWAGRREHRADRMRSMPLGSFAPLFELPRTTYVSVQKGEPVGQVGGYFGPAPLVNLGPEIEDFDDTAAVLSLVETLVCVDTSVAHLAAAMGRPVWLLSRINGCWRWLTGRDDSPWYPSLRVYRQTTPCDWAPVVARLCRDLAAL